METCTATSVIKVSDLTVQWINSVSFVLFPFTLSLHTPCIFISHYNESTMVVLLGHSISVLTLLDFNKAQFLDN